MAYAPKANVEVKGSEVHISGADAARLQPERIAALLQERLACAATNKCRAGDDIATKVKCVTSLIQGRFVRAKGSGQVSARKTDSGLVVNISGHEKALAPDRLQDLTRRVVACAGSHEASDNPRELWKCVSTLGEAIFTR